MKNLLNVYQLLAIALLIGTGCKKEEAASAQPSAQQRTANLTATLRVLDTLGNVKSSFKEGENFIL